MNLLENKAKMSLRITTSDFDDEISDLVASALLDLQLAGIKTEGQEENPLIIRAVLTYCKLHFGNLDKDEADRLAKSYELQRSQLYMSSGFTTWENTDDTQ